MAQGDSRNQVTGWAGWVIFAGIMLLFSGVLQMIMGLTALVNDTFFVTNSATNTLVVFDISTWGWIHLFIGLFIICAGVALFSGSGWARAIAVVLVSLNFLAQFTFMGVYPIWSIIMMILDLIVIYALTVHGGELKEA